MKNWISCDDSRLKYIDIAKGIGILFVILGHILPDNSSVKAAIYTFHMPLFFLVYGMVLEPIKFSLLFRKRGRSLLVPYLLWSIAFMGVNLNKKTLLLLWGSNESLLLAESNGMLWFLVVMFVGSVIANGTLLLIKGGGNHEKSSKLFLLSIVLLIASMVLGIWHQNIVFKNHAMGMPLSMDVSLLSASFILAGYWLKRCCLRFLTINKGILLTLGIALFSLAAIGIFNPYQGNNPSMAVFNVGFVPLYWILAILASIGIILISYVISDRKVSKPMVILGQNTFLIFIIHRTVVYHAKTFLAIHSNVLLYIAALIMISIYSLICSGLIVRFIPELAGRKSKGRDN